MARPPHDPVHRLNQHHADDVLAVAREFGGRPDATSARVVAIDSSQLDIAVETPTGPVEAHIVFGTTMPDVGDATSPRLLFRNLARRARDQRG